MLEVVKTLRVARFLTSLYMTNNQKELVKFERQYCINPSKTHTGGNDAQHIKMADVLDQFRPDTNDVDRMLYEHVVDDKLRNHDYTEASSSSASIEDLFEQNQMNLEEFIVDWKHE